MAFDKREGKVKFAALREAVSEALREADPIGLLQEGAPADEYDPEIGTILPRLRAAESAADVQRIVHQEFAAWFGEEIAGSPGGYERAAVRIWAAVRQLGAV